VVGGDNLAVLGSHGSRFELCTTEDAAYAVPSTGQPVLPVPKPLCAVRVELAACPAGRPAVPCLRAVGTILRHVVLTAHLHNISAPSTGAVFSFGTICFMSRDFWRSFLVITPVAFALHFVWETLHIPLYTNYGDIGVLPLALYAALGDVFYTLLAVAGVALYKRDAGWMRRARGGDYAALALLGLCVAVFVEYKAMLLHLWEYAPVMPTLFGFGLSPLLQMAVLLPLSAYISRCILKRQ